MIERDGHQAAVPRFKDLKVWQNGTGYRFTTSANGIEDLYSTAHKQVGAIHCDRDQRNHADVFRNRNAHVMVEGIAGSRSTARLQNLDALIQLGWGPGATKTAVKLFFHDL